MQRAKITLLGTFLAFLAPHVGPAQEPFPVGVWYGGGKARAPMLAREPGPEREAWKKDLQTIKSLGFNSVKCWVDWATAEPVRGRYRFENLEQLLSLADEIGLKVIVQLYADSAPEWLSDRYADASFVTERGDRIGSQASPGFCLDHPGVREDMGKFIAAVAQRAAAHPSFFAFDLWSEPHVVNWVWFNHPVEFCYCPYTQAKFRVWLKAKYGTLEGLNRAWYRTFERWEQVEPPRYGTILSYTDFIDWKTFITDKLRGDLKMKADAARGAFSTAVRSGPPKPFLLSSHSDVPSVLANPLSGFGSPDDWWMSQVVDHYGTSIYPKHASSQAPWSPVRLAAGLDGIRSAAREKGWWIGELQAGQGATGVRVANPVTGADLRLWGWTVLSRGARAISYYAWYPMSSGYESNGYGMIELDGRVTERARIAGQFARVVHENAALLRALRPQEPQAAILYNRLSSMAGGNTVGPGQTVRNSLLGFYRAAFERNIPVDFAHPEEIAAGRANRYKMIYLAYPLMLSRPVAQALKEYVRQGGTLVAEARPAWNDERGFANDRIPGFGLDEVFGCREKLLRSPATVEMVLEPDLPGPFSSLSGSIVRGTIFAQHLEVTDPSARILARFPVQDGEPGTESSSGDPAIVLSRHGKGQALLIGSFPAAAYEQEQNPATGRFLRQLLSFAGVEPTIRTEGAPGLVEARFLESRDALLFIGINHADSEQKVDFTLPSSLRVVDAKNLETGAAVRLAAGSEGPRLSHQFGARDVLVLVLPRARSAGARSSLAETTPRSSAPAGGGGRSPRQRLPGPS